MPPAVQLRSVVALAGRFPALSGIDLSVETGEVVLLLGPNGSGKTSVLRTLCGLLDVTAGEAMVLGYDLREDRSAVRDRVGLLGHAAPLYDELTAKESVRFATRAIGRPVAAADSALERLGLVGRLARTQVSRLSAGQKRRVAIASLLARSPELWLLDEPHTGLDAVARRLLAELIDEAVSAGVTVILSSHEREAAFELCDRAVTLGGGCVTGEERGGRRALSALKDRTSHVA